MFLSSVLQVFKTVLSDTHALREYTVQITPDERPFPHSGERTITLYGSEFIRSSTKDSREYQSSIKLSVNSRVTYAPRDRQKDIIYLNTLKSISNTCDIILSILDSNNSILGLINTQVNTTRTEVITDLDDSPNDETSYINMINNTSVIGPMRVLGYTAQPIPRFDDFFTGYSEKRDVPFQEGNSRITESGYSMVVTVQGPKTIFPLNC